MTRHGVPTKTNTISHVRRGDIPDLQVIQAVNHLRGMVSVTSPLPHHIKEVLPGTPIPKGKACLVLVQLKDLMNKEVATFDVKKGRKGFASDGIPMNNAPVKRKIKEEA